MPPLMNGCSAWAFYAKMAVASLCLMLAIPIAMAVERPLFDSLTQVDRAATSAPVPQRVAAMRSAYAQAAPVRMERSHCLALTDERLEDLFQATALIAFYARDTSSLQRLQCLHDALVARGQASAAHHRALRGTLISLQQFERANAVGAALADAVATLPTIRGSVPQGRPLLGLISLNEAERVALSEDGLRVVAMVHPYCGFSRRALEAITTQAKYAWLRPHLQLVVPIGQQWPGRELIDWNAAHAELPMRPMVVDPAWGGFEQSETPAFHLVRDGTVIATVTGWRGEGAELGAIRAAWDAEQR